MSCLDRSRFLFSVTLVALVVLAACTHFERLKMPLTHRVDRRVRHKELIRIDNRVYVKVLDPESKEQEPRRNYIYVPVEEYLTKPESYDAVVESSPNPQEEEWSPVELETVSLSPEEEKPPTQELKTPPHFKKRVMIISFTDLANPDHGSLSEIVKRTLSSKIRARSEQVILFDAEIMKQTLKAENLGIDSFESPETMRLANQLHNIHAIVMGTINHFFTSSTESKVKGKGKTAYAIAELSTKLVDAASGKVLRVWEKRNPIFASEGKGDFSEEKAQLKAIDLITSELSAEIIDEMKGVEWYTTIAGVEGSKVYVSAGKLSGVRVGDVFSVYPASSPGEPKGEIRVATLFGVDSSVADIAKGEDFRPNDMVRPAFP
ncbi:MAG: hypothetical protein GTN81_05865 [Proteobacteria bacterium]|nr:hypothetical protein [Pseudomonadota bacterium]